MTRFSSRDDFEQWVADRDIYHDSSRVSETFVIAASVIEEKADSLGLGWGDDWTPALAALGGGDPDNWFAGVASRFDALSADLR